MDGAGGKSRNVSQWPNKRGPCDRQGYTPDRRANQTCPNSAPVNKQTQASSTTAAQQLYTIITHPHYEYPRGAGCLSSALPLSVYTGGRTLWTEAKEAWEVFVGRELAS